MRGRAPRGVTGELSPASVYVSLLPVVEACVVVAVPGRVGEVRVAADEPEAVDLDPGVLARRLDAPATVKAVLEQGGRVLLRSRAVLDPGPSGGRVRGVELEQNHLGTGFPPPSSYPSPSSPPSRHARNRAQEVWARQRTGTHTKS